MYDTEILVTPRRSPLTPFRDYGSRRDALCKSRLAPYPGTPTGSPPLPTFRTPSMPLTPAYLVVTNQVYTGGALDSQSTDNLLLHKTAGGPDQRAGNHHHGCSREPQAWHPPRPLCLPHQRCVPGWIHLNERQRQALSRRVLAAAFMALSITLPPPPPWVSNCVLTGNGGSGGGAYGALLCNCLLGIPPASVAAQAPAPSTVASSPATWPAAAGPRCHHPVSVVVAIFAT